MNQQVIIFDTTLRDGEQALQTSLSVKEKLQIAFALEKLGVDIMEVGFPISSPGDFESVRTISKQIKSSLICGLARCLDQDIDIAAEALKSAEKFRIHIFLPTSAIHIKSKLRKNFYQITEMAVHAIRYARKYTDDIEFSCEDAGRTSIENLCRIVEIAIQSGARTINIPDTVGYTTPYQFGNIIKTLYNKVPIIDQAIISVHCHNDLGMAVGNSISAIESGARQIEGTINGIGERAGNTALEEVIMAIKVRSDLNVYTNIRHKEIYHTSQIVSQLCNMPIPDNKAIVGANAFSHSSGIHQDGILKNKANYEIMAPKDIGLKSIKLNLTPRSGRAAVRYHMQNMGYQETDYNMDKLYNIFVELADKKGRVFDYELEALAFITKSPEKIKYFKLQSFTINSNVSKIYTISIKLYCGEKKQLRCYSTTGNDPIHTAYKVLMHITGFTKIKIEQYQLSIKQNNYEMFKKVNIKILYNKRNFHGTGLSKDIITSSINAMIHALNNIWISNQASINYQKSLKK